MTRTAGATTSSLETEEFLSDDSDQLVRRFVLYDIVSGLSSSSDGTPDVIRYATNISLEVSLSDSYRMIYSPVLTIAYGEVLPSTFPASSDTNDDLQIKDVGVSASIGGTPSRQYTAWTWMFSTSNYSVGASPSVYVVFTSYSTFNWYPSPWEFCGLRYVWDESYDPLRIVNIGASSYV